MRRSRRWLTAAAITTVWFLSCPIFSLGEQKSSSPQGPVPPQAPAAQAPATTPDLPTEGDRQKEAEELKRLQEFYLRNQSVFIKKGELVVELNTFYSTDKRQEFISIGAGQSTLIQSTRRFFDTTLFARAGILTDGLELDVIFPFLVHADQEIRLLSGSSSSSSTGIGDISAALRYQVWYERGIRPGLIVDIQGKSRSGGDTLRGTGNNNIGGGVTLLKSIDPVVFFGRLGYTETLSHDGRNLGNIFDYSVGMGFSLNDRVAFNMQFIGSLIGKSKIQGEVIDGSSLEIASLQFSATILVTKQLFVEPIVVIGMTDDAFDSTIGIRIPYRF